MKITWIVLVFSFVCLAAKGQEVKTEQEERINVTEVPQESRDWLGESFSGLEKVKWYREETSGKKSYEAKFKRAGDKFSVEFSEEGLVEDVEIGRRLSELAGTTRQKLESAFGQFKRFKVRRFQEQWTASSPDLLQAALLNNNSSAIEVRYEVVFKALIDGQHTFWEGLFDQEGKLLQRRKVSLRPTDNLDF